MTNSRLERALNLIEKMKRRKRMDELKSLPQLVDWSPFLMVLEHGDSVWIGVGPDHSTYIENYAGWKYVSKVGSPPGGMPSSSVPGTPDRCGGCWWNISADSANLKNIIDKVRRLVASDQREFSYIKNGVPIIGNLPEAQSLGRARLVTFVERQILVFPKNAPGAREFAMAANFPSNDVAIVDENLICSLDALPISRLPEELRPVGDAVKLPLPHAQVSGQDWLCTILFRIPLNMDNTLTPNSAITLTLLSNDAPGEIDDKTRKVQFPACEWPQWSAWMQGFGISWTTEEGCDPEAPWNHPVDDAMLVRLPGWKTPTTSGRSLHAFQRDGVRFAITRGMRALLGDDMGLGKTVQSIMAALYHRMQRVVVVAPASVRGVWEDELLSWDAATRDQIQLLQNGNDRPKNGTRWLVCSYEQITPRNLPWRSANNAEHQAIIHRLKELSVKHFDNHEKDNGVFPVKKKNTITFPLTAVIPDSVIAAIRESLSPRRQATWDRFWEQRAGALLRAVENWNPDLVIFDEGHRLKNREAKRTNVGIQLSGASGGCLLLSGTPVQNNTNEPAVLLHVLDPAAYKDVKDKRFSIERIKELIKPAMIRRLKNEVLTQLPPVVEQIIHLTGGGLETIGNRIPEDSIEPNLTILQFLQKTGNAVLDARKKRDPWQDFEPVERTEYAVLRAAWSVGPRNGDNLSPVALFEMARARLGLAKAQASQTVDLIVDILENRGRLVIYTAHHAAADHLAGSLTKKHWKTVVLDGRMAAHKRTDVVAAFQAGKFDCLIAGIEAAGEGITLHRADTCLFLEMAMKPSTIRQARDRLHRIGQESTVQAFYLVADNPIDRFFRDLCLNKADLVGKVLEEEVQVLGESRGETRIEPEPERLCAVVQTEEVTGEPHSESDVTVLRESKLTVQSPSGLMVDGEREITVLNEPNVTESVDSESVHRPESTGNNYEFEGMRKRELEVTVKADPGANVHNKSEIEKDGALEVPGGGKLEIMEQSELEVTESSGPEITVIQKARAKACESEVTGRGALKVTEIQAPKTVARKKKVVNDSALEVTDNSELKITVRTGVEKTAVCAAVVTETLTKEKPIHKKRRAAQWESQHPDKVRAQTAARVKRYRERHPEKVKNDMKAYRQAHKSDNREYMREYRKGNEELKVKHREYMRAWRATRKAAGE